MSQPKNKFREPAFIRDFLQEDYVRSFKYVLAALPIA